MVELLIDNCGFCETPEQHKQHSLNATLTYEIGKMRTKRTPEPEGQLYHRGQVMNIKRGHGWNVKYCVIDHTYGHAYPSISANNVKDYSVFMFDENAKKFFSLAWVHESELTPLEDDVKKDELLEILKDSKYWKELQSA